VTTSAPTHTRLSKDGVFFIGSDVRPLDIAGGTSTTLHFGERSLSDPEFDFRRPVWPVASSLAAMGK
jgi:hypothetical protein